MAATPYVELILEETPRPEGAATTTPYRLSSNKFYIPVTSAVIQPNMSPFDRGDELRGIQGTLPDIPDTFAPSASIDEHAYFNNLVPLLALSGFDGTFTAGNGVITDPDSGVIPTGASRWVFNKRTSATAQTAQLTFNYDPEPVILRGQGFGVTDLSLTADGALSATFVGLVTANLASYAATPAYDSAAIPPARRRDLQLTSWLASSSSATDFSLAISNPLAPYRSMGVASGFPDIMDVANDGQVLVTGAVPKRTIEDADFNAVMNSTTFSATARWVSDKVIGATAYTYKMWVQMPACQYTSYDPDAIANRRRFGATYNWKAAYDEASGFDCKITVVCAVAAIATYP